jgi:hypothetical protein
MVPRGEKEMIYAPESETDALIQDDNRTPAQKLLDTMIAQRDTFEQGQDDYRILYQIALELIEKDME